MASRGKSTVPDELLDRPLDGSDALEAFQSGDLDHHLDDEEEQSSGNHRNGHSRKRVLTDDGRLDLSLPRAEAAARPRLAQVPPRREARLYPRHWDSLQLFLTDGRVKMDNNSVKSPARPIALSRKNALFAGHD